MFRTAFLALATAAVLPAAAMAQDIGQAIPYVGISGGYHQLEEIDASFLGGNNDISIDGFIFGGYAGVHLPVGESLIVGGEGNFNFGTGDIDNEYGLTAHVGTMIGRNSMMFVRGGYQWVDLDFDGLAEKTADGFNFQGQDRQDFINAFNNSAGDDTAGDYLVGVGGEFGLGQSTAFRITVDTISFDTVRVGGGMTFRF
tara:strand:+ start:57910 stop:58506 length:597 start_codon:yes stop_codon:yes gene_type:complete